MSALSRETPGKARWNIAVGPALSGRGDMAKILVVEDDDSIRDFTARALRASGHTVDTAEDGDSGLQQVVDAGREYELVLSDIRMPVMNGIEMAKRASSSHPDLKILLMTGYAEQRERAADLQDIVVDVISKPFTLTDLRKSVEHALRL